MTLQEAQTQVDTWIKTVGVRYFTELTNTAILMEEVGEVARIMARTYGDQSFKKADLAKDQSDRHRPHGRLRQEHGEEDHPRRGAA
jgi:NTP pyrophosphatase (non-canonical NTP hydrolase)